MRGGCWKENAKSNAKKERQKNAKWAPKERTFYVHVQHPAIYRNRSRTDIRCVMQQSSVRMTTLCEAMRERTVIWLVDQKYFCHDTYSIDYDKSAN